MLDDALWYIKQDPTIVQTYSQETQQTSTTFFSDKSMVYLIILCFVLISSFGRWVTVPSIQWKWRKMRKYWRLIYLGVWLVLSFLLVSSLIASFILSLFISYILLWFGVLMWLYGKTGSGSWPLWFGWGWGWFGSWGWSFWWFGGWSFGWGWSSWSR